MPLELQKVHLSPIDLLKAFLGCNQFPFSSAPVFPRAVVHCLLSNCLLRIKLNILCVKLIFRSSLVLHIQATVSDKNE